MGRTLSWLLNAAMTVWVIAREAVLSLRYNWGVGLLSVVLALSLWVYVTDREDPERTGRVPGTVPIEVVNEPANETVFPRLSETVTVRARAAESVFERLSADDFRATVDLSDVSGQQATVRIRVESEESRAVVVSFSPAEVTVTLENVTSRTVPVRTQLVGAPPRGFQAREITVQPEEVLVTGPESLVSRVEAVEVNVNLTGVRTNFEQTLLLRAQDAGRGSIQDVDVEPPSAVVQVEIVQLESSATFIVQPHVRGLPADGYNVTAIQADPQTVVVSGPAEVLQSIDAVRGVLTEEVSIDGATADVIRTVALRLPQGASIDQPAVTVRVSITPARGQFSFEVIPQVTNLAPGLSAALAPPRVQVVLEGAVPSLRALDPTEIRATLDLGGLDAGDHLVPVRVQAPIGTTIVSITPVEVSVTLRPP